MAITVYKPTTPGRRGMSTLSTRDITTKKPLRSLVVIKKRTNGRNNQGRITTRHRGGGAKRYYRLVNFRLAEGKTATVEHIEYDPNRSARIARIKDGEGQYHYILASNGMAVGQTVVSGAEAPIENGNRLPLKNTSSGEEEIADEPITEKRTIYRPEADEEDQCAGF
jgi:large subunit ribosomal protein L2